MNKKGLIGTIFIVGILIFIGFFWFIGEYNSGGDKSIQLANPASVYCVNQGYMLDIRSTGEGDVGYCVASDGQECEEWGFYRGECSLGGYDECVKVQTTCCSCNMGGGEKCVLTSEVDEYEMNLSECSEDILCAAMFNCQIESCKYVDGGCVAI